MKVTRRIEIDYGHTLPDHFSFCNQVHGHRGVIEATFGGEIQTSGSSNGMVEDFKILKEVLMKTIHDKIDHGFAVWGKDTALVPVNTGIYTGIGGSNIVNISTLEFIKARNSKVLMTDEPPTAEYLAKWAFNQVIDYLQENNRIDIYLENLRWYETPNNWADYTLADYVKAHPPKKGDYTFKLDDTAKYFLSFAERHNLPL